MTACGGDDSDTTGGDAESDARADRAGGTGGSGGSGGSSRGDAQPAGDATTDGSSKDGSPTADARDAYDASVDAGTGGSGWAGGAGGVGGTGTSGGAAGTAGATGGSGGASGGSGGTGGAAGAGGTTTGGAGGSDLDGSAGSTGSGGAGGAAGSAGTGGTAGNAGSGGAGTAGATGTGGAGGVDGGTDAAPDVSSDGAGGSGGTSADAGNDSTGDAANDPGSSDGGDADPAEAGDAASAIAVTLCPKNTVLLPGQSMAFTADVTGTGNQAVFYGIVGGTSGGGSDSGSVDRGTVGSTGIYTAPAIPGVYQVVANSQQDTSKSDTATITVVADNAVTTVRGTISAPAGSGRIFVSIREWQGGGTVLDAPGPYVIRGSAINPSFPNITVAAYRDIEGVGSYLSSVDPYGETTVSWNGTSVTGVDVTLANPGAPAFSQGPSGVAIWPAGGSVVAKWERIRDFSGNEVPQSYRLYISTSPNPGPDAGTSIVKTLRAGGPDFAVIGPLTNGTPFYFAISGVTGAIESPLSPVTGPVTPAPPAGGHSISGTVSFGFPGQGALYVIAVGSGKRIWGARIANPQSPQSFTVSGLPDGRYDVGAFFDLNGDGEASASEPLTYRRQAGLPIVGVAGADVSNVALSLPGTDGNAWIITRYEKEGSSTPEYRVRIAVGSNVKRVDKVVLIGGPGVVPPVDMRLTDDGVFQVDQSAGPSAPTVGASYDFEVTDQNGRTCNLSAAVSGVWTSLPTALQPSGGDAGSATPTFVWLAPGVTPSPFWYRMSVWELGPTNDDAWSTGVPGSYSSVVYNDDGRASLPSLPSGKQYNWAILASDVHGNIAGHKIWFGVP